MVVLTFLYTNCPDVCPIVTSRLREVQTLLESDADDARFVAVSVDPERDTIESAREYLDKWGLSANWHFLVGDRPELEEVWKAYYVDPAVSDHDPLESGQAGPTPEPRGAIDALSAEIAKRYLVIHSTPVFLIDREGRRRVVFTPPLEAEEVEEGHQAADRRRLGRGFEFSLGGFSYLGEGIGVAHGDVREHLAVHLDACELQAVDQLAVSDAVGASGGVYLDVPQLAHISLALAPVGEGIGVGVKHGLVRLPEQPVTASLVALGHLQYLLVASSLGYAASDPSQLSYLAYQTYNRPLQ